MFQWLQSALEIKPELVSCYVTLTEQAAQTGIARVVGVPLRIVHRRWHPAMARTVREGGDKLRPVIPIELGRRKRRSFTWGGKNDASDWETDRHTEAKGRLRKYCIIWNTNTSHWKSFSSPKQHFSFFLSTGPSGPAGSNQATKEKKKKKKPTTTPYWLVSGFHFVCMLKLNMH